VIVSPIVPVQNSVLKTVRTPREISAVADEYEYS